MIASFYLNKLGTAKLSNIKRRCHGHTFRYASACAGTEITRPCTNAVVYALQGLQINMQMESQFTCEFNAKKQKFILDNFPQTEKLFKDHAIACILHSLGILVSYADVYANVTAFVGRSAAATCLHMYVWVHVCTDACM